MTTAPRLRFALPIVLAAALAAPVTAHAGGLDTSFGTGGGMVQDLPGEQDAAAVAALADGRIQVAGTEIEGGVQKLMLRRYLANGAPDTTFGAQGVSRALIGVGQNQVSDLAIQQDGKLVVALTARPSSAGNDTDAYVVRLTSTGMYDSTFGTKGVVRIAAATTFASTGELAVSGTGRVVLSYSESGAPRLLRLTSAGRPDTTFNTSGLAAQFVPPGFVPSTYAQKTAGGIKILNDGSIVQAISVQSPMSMGYLLKYNSAGTTVAPFGGQMLTTATDVDTIGSDIVFSGHAVCPSYTPEQSSPVTTSVAIARLTATGAVRVTSGSGGVTLMDCQSNGWGRSTGLAVTPQNVIVVAGDSVPYPTRSIPMTWRLTNTGTLAAGYGTNGGQSVEFGARTGSHSNYHSTHDIAVHGTGAIAAISANTRWLMDPNIPGDSDTGLARVNP